MQIRNIIERKISGKITSPLSYIEFQTRIKKKDTKYNVEEVRKTELRFSLPLNNTMKIET